MKKYLFITGCPRSGTSALSLLIGAHPKIAMGVERFHNLVIPNFKLKRDHFSEQRFFDFKPSDSHIKLQDQPRIELSYQSLKERYGQCDYVGDKIPYLYDYYNELVEEFAAEDQLSLIVIIRNVFDVANSYEHRAADENQKWSRDYKKAVGDWNRCMRKTLNLSQSFDKITLVQYEDLYGGQNLDLLHSIFNDLDLKTSKSVIDFYNEQLKQSRKKEQIRNENYLLTTKQKRLICLNSKNNLYKKLVNNFIGTF